MEPTLTLSPGQRVRVTQRVPQASGETPIVVEGEVIRLAREKTGSWYAHTKDHKVWLDRLELRKPNGELVALNLDQYSKVEPL